MGRSGQSQPGGVYKFSMPRKDMKVAVGGIEVKPDLALGSWVAFEKMGDRSMAMGDSGLAHSEVEPVMKSLEESGVQITALHNHLLIESPRVTHMHIAAEGDAVKFAHAIRDALALTMTPTGSALSAAGTQTEVLGIDQS